MIIFSRNTSFKSVCFLESCRGPALKQQVSITELLNSSRSDQHHLLGDDETSGLQEHTEENCLYCSARTVLDSNTHNHLINTHTRTGDSIDITLLTLFCDDAIKTVSLVTCCQICRMASLSGTVSHLIITWRWLRSQSTRACLAAVTQL